MNNSIKENLKYNSDTGVFTRLKSNSNRVKVGDIAGYKNLDGYIVIRLNSKPFYAHRLAWSLFYGSYPSHEIDHINGNKSDNRISNLRACDKFQNQCNRSYVKGSRVKHKGVDYINSRKKYRARIRIRGVSIHIGLFDNLEDAVLAYNKKALEMQEGYNIDHQKQR